MSESIYIPIVQIRSNGLLSYWESTDSARYGSQSGGAYDKHATYTGIVNSISANKIKRAVMILCACAKVKTAWDFKRKKQFKFKVNFITLTLPAAQCILSDKYLLTTCFQPFIKRMLRRWGNVSYVWRAERQENNNVHFHLTTDTWISLYWIRENWNQLLSRTPLIDQFEHNHNHRNPNSTDIHAVWKARDLPAYISKYMTKKDKNKKPLTIKTWGCSENLKSAKWPSMIMEYEIEEIWKRANKLWPDNMREGDHYNFIWLTSWAMNRLIKGKVLDDWLQWQNSIIPDRQLILSYPFYDQYTST